MTYYTTDVMNVETDENGKKDWDHWFDQVMETGIKMVSRVKTELVREGAQILKSQGKTEGLVVNIKCTKPSEMERYPDIMPRILHQSWYVYCDNGQWFFKMDAKCKAKHLITNVQ